MKTSLMLAIGIFLVAGLWILSGQFGEPIHEKDVAERSLEVTPEADAPTRVRVLDITAKPHDQELVLFGRTEADRQVILRARTDGHVETIVLADGARADHGDDIIELSMDDRMARLEEAKAMERQYRLAYEAGVDLSKKSFRSRVSLAGNKADWEAAKARLNATELDIEHTRIIAPFAGVVEDIKVEIGDFVKEGDEIAMLVDMDPLVISAEVTERDIFDLVEGVSATVTLANGEVRSGFVRFISKSGNEVTRTFRIEVEVPNMDYSASEGLTAELTVALGEVKAHFVSPAVITLSETGAVGIKAVDDTNTVVFYPVRILADTNAGIWLAGLPDQVRLITVGQEFVRAGQKVTPVPEQSAPQSPVEPQDPIDRVGPEIVQPKPQGEAS